MQINKWGLIILFSITNWYVVAADGKDEENNQTDEIVVFSGGPEHKKYPVKVSKGPFAKRLQLSEKEKKNSAKWKKRLQQELAKPVNFAGHYRLFIDYKAVFRRECDLICGWVIDKHTGNIVTGLPWFNGNNSYYGYINDQAIVPDDLEIEFYPDSSIIYIYGENIPRKKMFPLGKRPR